MVVHIVKPGDDRELVGKLLLILQSDASDILHGFAAIVELDGHEYMVAVQDAVTLAEFLQVVGETEAEVMAQRLVGMVFLGVEGVQEG